MARSSSLLRKTVGWLGAIGLLSGPVAAHASCADLGRQRDAVMASGFDVFSEYPKTHAALVACYSSAATEDDFAGCAGTVFIGLCLFESFSSCVRLKNLWADFNERRRNIEIQMQAFGCSR